MAQTTQLIFYAFLGGILPALLWLWFWLREDCHPEPRKIIFWTFLAGAAVIPIVFLLEYALLKMFIRLNWASASYYPVFLIFIWAGIEEYFKYFAAKKSALEKKYFDEPVDALIYLITAALGFAALENVLFLFKEFTNEGISAGLLSGNLRFLGASLTHVVSSGFVGASIAFSFFHKEHRGRNILGGLLVATVLHGFFNYFIMKSGENIFNIFLGVWIFAVIIIYIFEKMKKNNER